MARENFEGSINTDEKNVRLRSTCNQKNLVEVNKKLTTEQRDRIQKTPFKWVQYMPKNFKISGSLLWELVSRWDESKGFRVKNKVVRFTEVDVFFAVGLPIKDKQVQVDKHVKCKTLSLFGGSIVTIPEIVESLANEDDLDDFCRLYILLAFGEFYFPKTGKQIYTDIIKPLDDLESLNEYNWGLVVYDFLVKSLNKAADIVRKGKNLSQAHLTGCAAILQIWALNHLLVGKIPSEGFDFPRILNWENLNYNKKTIEDEFKNNVIIEKITATAKELEIDMVKNTLQEVGYLDATDYQQLVEDNKQLQERIFLIEKEVRMLKDASFMDFTRYQKLEAENEQFQRRILDLEAEVKMLKGAPFNANTSLSMPMHHCQSPHTSPLNQDSHNGTPANIGMHHLQSTPTPPPPNQDSHTDITDESLGGTHQEHVDGLNVNVLAQPTSNLEKRIRDNPTQCKPSVKRIRYAHTYERKKKENRKSKVEIEKENALKKTLSDGAYELVEYKGDKTGKCDDMAAACSSSVALRRNERRRRSNMEKEKEKVDNKEKKHVRKRKIISSSEENEAAQEEKNGKVIKNKKGPGRKGKIAKKNLVSGKKPESGVLGAQDEDFRESEMPIDCNGYGLRNHKDSKLEQEVPKVNMKDAKWIEKECLFCHQCQRNDRGRVVRCPHCKRKRFCIPCLSSWYPHLKEDDIAEACPVCCGNCNCTPCLRSGDLINEIKEKLKTNEDKKVEHSMYLLKKLLPYLRQLEKEQMIEKEIEAKRQGLSLSELKIEVADYSQDEQVYWLGLI